MIRNLNQLTFQGYGSILPERSHTDRLSGKGSVQRRLSLSQRDIAIYQCVQDCWVCCDTGTTTLSVSHDKETYQHFYLDKPVTICAGVYFSLAPFLGESTAVIAYDTAPVVVGQRSRPDNFSICHRFQVKNLYTFFYQEKEQGFLFPGEAHPMLELTYVDQGSMHSVADGTDLLLRQGDMVLYGPNQWHMQYADIGVAPRFVTVSFDVEGGDLEPLYNRIFSSSQRVATLLTQMLREREKMDEYATDMILFLLSQLLVTWQRESQSPADRLKTAHAIHSENEIIRHAQQYITAHIREKLSVPLVARRIDVSPSYLTALFHKHLQISPGEYIRRIKLQESKQMIRENTMNFTEIAAALQYSTVHHFSRQFKEKFGITPTEYAKSVR